MLDILQDHLSLTQPPAMFDLYERANDLFDKFDLEDYQLGYQDLLITADGAGDGLRVADNTAIYNLTMQYLLQITTEHQITLNNDASMRNYVELLEFIKQIEYTELIQECADVLGCEEYDNLDKFGKCMDIVSSIPEEDSMLFLETIPDCLIRTMKAYFDNRVTLEVETESLDPETRDVFREMDKYARIIKGQEMRSYKYLFEEEGVVGLPFEYHYNQNEQYLVELNSEALIYECIGYALLSEGGLNNPQQTIIDCLGKYNTDLDALTKLQYDISKVLIDYRNEVASGIGIVN